MAVQLNSWVAPPPVQAWTASTCPPCCYRRQDYYTAAASLLQHFWRSTPAAAAVAARLRDLCSEAVLLLQLKQHKLLRPHTKTCLIFEGLLVCFCYCGCLPLLAWLVCLREPVCCTLILFEKKMGPHIWWCLPLLQTNKQSDDAVHVKEWFVRYTTHGVSRQSATSNLLLTIGCS